MSYEETLDSPEAAQAGSHVFRIATKSIRACELSGVPVTPASAVVLLWAIPAEFDGVKMLVVHADLWDKIALLLWETSRSDIKFWAIDGRKVS